MDAYDATRIVLSRIQSMDPENASKIMGLLLIQDHGDKEMIRLAFGPEALLHSVVLKARKDLGLLPPSAPSTPSSPLPSPFLLARQNSASRLLSSNGGAGAGFPSPSSWAPPPVFSRNGASSNGSAAINGVADDLHGADDHLTGSSASCGVSLPGSSSCTSTAAPFPGADLIEEFQLLDQLSFLSDPSAAVSSAGTPLHALHTGPKGNGDFLYPDMAGDVCRSPSSNGDGMLFPYAGVSWGMNSHHRRSYSAVDRCSSSEVCSDFGWRPCLYFARGYCKNGNSCRFLHGLPDDTAAPMGGTKMDGAMEQHFHELLLRSKTQRQPGSAPQIMATAASFPYSPSPASPSAGKCMNFLLQPPQPPQNESRRAAAAAAALSLGAGGEEQQHNKFGRPRLDRISSDYAGAVNPGSRQIYLTFPADCTFREEDVANYFSIYGPVQDVRIPYQQKRMFGFVTFVYPETVKLILAKGNPHFVCDARVLVKPYKEKGKVPDKKQQQQDADRGVFSGCPTPTALDSKLDPYDLQLLGASMLYTSNQEMLLRKKQLEDLHQAAELQQVIELRRRRFAGLQLLDLKNRNPSSAAVPVTPSSGPINSYAATTVVSVSTPNAAVPLAAAEVVSAEELPRPEAAVIGARAGATGCVTAPASLRQPANDAAAGADDEEDARDDYPKGGGGGGKECAEHNLPDSPFASPTKCSFAGDAFSLVSETTAEASSPVSASLDNIDGIINSNNSSSSSHLITSSLLPAPSTLDVASFNSCFFPVARFSSSGHGAVGM